MQIRNSVSHNETTSSANVRSLQRGLRVLNCFTPAAPFLGIKNIADALGIPKGSAFRLVATLEHDGYLVQDSDTKKYRLGLRTLNLTTACVAGLRSPDIAVPHLENLARRIQLSASMAMLDRSEIVYVARTSISNVLLVNLSVGSRLPAFCSTMGRILWAHLDEATLATYIAETDFRPLTPYTVTDPKVVRELLNHVRTKGYAESIQELALGVRSIAAPVRDASGQVVAAIAASMYLHDFQEEYIAAEIVPSLLETAMSVSTSLGFSPAALLKDLRPGFGKGA